MKKVTSFLMVAAIAFGFAACNSEDGPNVDPSQETTHATLQISTAKQMFTRADQADEAGRDAESTVALIDLLSDVESTGIKTWNALGSVGAGGAEYPQGTQNFFDLTGGVYTVSPWKTTVGPQNLALLLNGGSLSSERKGTIANAPDHVVSLTDEPIADFSTDGSFVMSSKTFAVNVLPNITLTQIQDASNTQNVFSENVERVVCQGIVTLDAATAGSYTTANTTDSKGQLTGLKYGGAMGASKTYLYANHAGERTMTGTSPNLIYKNYTSAIHSVAVEDNQPTNFGETYGLHFAKAELTSLQTIAKLTGTPTAAGFYFLENSMPIPADNKDWKYSRSAYAKIYGVYTPSEVLKRDAGDALVFVAKAGTGLWYNTSDLSVSPQTTDPSTPPWSEGYVISNKPLVTDGSFSAGTTFYKGEIDGRFYLTPEAAFSSVNAPGQKSYKYEDGKCVYRSLWNRVTDSSDPVKTKNGNTRRNNIYVLNVTAFEKVGMNYDPNDPEDPNIIKPVNIYEPATPQGADPTVDEQDTYMRVEATILKWNKVSRDVVLK